MPPHRMMPGAYRFSVFRTCVRGYVRTNVRPSVRMCVRDPVRLWLRHLYQVEFCSFIVRYPTAGASVHCEHISSLINYCLERNLYVKLKDWMSNSVDPD